MNALRTSESSSIAFTGSGGKTTAMFQLARELSTRSPVVVTASSHLGMWQVSLADKHVVSNSGITVPNFEDELQGIALFTGEFEGDRTRPLSPETLDALHEFCIRRGIPLLIEADGSRQKPLKAWAEHEPPIPPFVDQVVHVVGLSGVGKPLSDEIVHRPEIFSKLSGLHAGEVITPEGLTRVATHSEGGRKNIPSHARKTVLVNQADTPELQSVAQNMTRSLLQYFHSVVIGSVEKGEVFAVHEPVAGIILAAGESRRLGKPKQLLDWKGQPFVRAVTCTALEAGLDPVIVVTGANRENVAAAILNLNVKVVINEDWAEGQGSSIKKGLQVLNFGNHVGAAIFLLVDQPQVTASILRALIEKHAYGLYPIVAPMVIDRRANPVLFDRVTFPDLLELEGDVGGRAIMHKHRVEYLPWHDDRLLLDVDTPEQYQRLISDETL